MKKMWLTAIIMGGLISSSCVNKISADMAAESLPESIVNVSVTEDAEENTAENTSIISQNISAEGQSYYRDFTSKANEDSYLLSGTVFQNQEKRGLVRVEAPDGITLSVKGKLKRMQGDIKLLYQGADGSVTVLAECSGETGNEVVADTGVVVEKGAGNIYFEGSGAVYQFDLSLSYSEDIRYYLTGDNPVS